MKNIILLIAIFTISCSKQQFQDCEINQTATIHVLNTCNTPLNLIINGEKVLNRLQPNEEYIETVPAGLYNVRLDNPGHYETEETLNACDTLYFTPK